MIRFCTLALITAALMIMGNISPPAAAADNKGPHWLSVTPQSQGMDADKLEAMWSDLKPSRTTALLVLRNDKIVFERYADGYSRTKPRGVASLTKALVGGVSLMVAMNDGRIKPDDLVRKYAPEWSNDPRKRRITIRHLATHTSGLEDAEAPAEDVPHTQLTGWKGDFWKYLPPPRDPFTLARDTTPVLDTPGTTARYSNPGMAMLGYCITASLHGTPDPDLRSLLRHRIMEPLGVPQYEWSCGYTGPTSLAGKSLIATWGGASYSPNAIACIGELMLHQGAWQGRRLLAASVVQAATRYAGMPNHSGLGWWVNHNPDGSRVWKAAPADAFWGAGAGNQFLLVIPSRRLVVVRTGELIDHANFDRGLEQHIVTPLMRALTTEAPLSHESTDVTPAAALPTDGPAAPYPPSSFLKRIVWAPTETIVRRAAGGDNWPLTWGDDDALYTAYGDGSGFDKAAPRLSLGLARVSGWPPGLSGFNIASATGVRRGSGAHGRKASGLLMVNGVLLMLARNAGNSQLAWSADHGQVWTWCDWKFTTSFGCPAFLNFGRNYNGARDRYVYLYSPDTASAYVPADSMVLARVPQDRVTKREAYEFFQRLNADGRPEWTHDINARGAVFRYPHQCLRSQMTYDAALKRYLWWQQIPNPAGATDQADTRFRGGFGVYDAPNPWGPWTTAYFTTKWDVGPGENGSFPTKWMSADGKTLYLVFSGDDQFSVRKATLTPFPGKSHG